MKVSEATLHHSYRFSCVNHLFYIQYKTEQTPVTTDQYDSGCGKEVFTAAYIDGTNIINTSNARKTKTASAVDCQLVCQNDLE